MKKTYMTPAISVMAMETAAILAGSGNNMYKFDSRPTSEPTMSDPTMESENQYSKEHTFDVWED